MAALMEATYALSPPASLRPYARWAARVGRYSFHTSRLVVPRAQRSRRAECFEPCHSTPACSPNAATAAAARRRAIGRGQRLACRSFLRVEPRGDRRLTVSTVLGVRRGELLVDAQARQAGFVDRRRHRKPVPKRDFREREPLAGRRDVRVGDSRGRSARRRAVVAHGSSMVRPRVVGAAAPGTHGRMEAVFCEFSPCEPEQVASVRRRVPGELWG